MMNTEGPTKAPTTAERDVECRRAFVEPQISDPVEVVNGNPAADALFAVAGSGTGP